MAGHILRDTFMSVDYKEGEHSNLVTSEFHHIVGAAFFIYSSMIFYFSGTGNSKWLAKQVSREQGEQLVFIPDALRETDCSFSLKEGEKIGFIFPIYSWGPPPIVLEFIKQLTLMNYGDHYLFFVCSCGDDIGLAKEVFEESIAAKGWNCNAGFSMIMPNNYVLFPGFDVDSKELEQKKLVDVVPELVKVNEAIASRTNVFLCKKGGFPFIKTRIIYPLFCRYGIEPKKFYATDACVGCKRCMQVCPMKNIEMAEGRPVWKKNCTSCLACYHICPKQAVQYGKITVKKGQYFNPNI